MMIVMKFLYKIEESAKVKRILYGCIIGFLFLYVFSIPMFGESTSFTRFMIYISMALLGTSTFLFCFLYGNFKLRREVVFVPLFVLIALVGTTLFSKQFREWFSLVLLMLSFIIFLYAFKIIGNKFIILKIITLAFFCFTVYFIYYFRNSFIHLNLSTRLGQPFDNQNGVAAFAVIGFSLPLYLLLFEKNKLRFLYIIPALSSLAVGFSTGSRSFLIISFVIVIIFLFFKFKKHKWVYLIVVAATIGLGIFFINLSFMSPIKDRLIVAFKTLIGTAEKVDTSTVERTVYVDYGFYLGSKNLLFGYGFKGFAIFSGVGTYSHSNFAEVICDFGIFGFIVFYLPLLILLFRSLFNKKIDKCFIITFFVYYFVISLTNVFYYKKIYYLILAFLYYICFFEMSLSKKVPVVENVRRLIFTCESMESGGAEKAIATLANSFSKKNISVTIIGVSAKKSDSSFYHLESDVKYITLLGNSNKKISTFKKLFLLRKTIRKYNPDVVISFLPHVITYTIFSLFFTGIPCIVSERNNPYIDPKGAVLRMTRLISFNLSNGCVFQTSGAMQYYSPKIVSKSIIIRNPIELEYVPSNYSRTRNKTILAVGRLVDQKNYKCLLDAFCTFNKKSGNGFKLKIYGEGPLKADLISYCKLLDIEKFVTFVGNKSNWHYEEYRDSMYILTSNYEGMPNALAEALALGIPSISTDCPTGGARELIQDGVNGFLVPVNDSKMIAEKMEAVEYLSINKIELSAKELLNSSSPEKIADMWLAFLKSLRNEIYE